MSRLRARHKLRHSLKFASEELPKEMRTREELGRDLKGRQPYFGVFLGQIGHEKLINSTDVGVRRPFGEVKQSDIVHRQIGASLADLHSLFSFFSCVSSKEGDPECVIFSTRSLSSFRTETSIVGRS